MAHILPRTGLLPLLGPQFRGLLFKGHPLGIELLDPRGGRLCLFPQGRRLFLERLDARLQRHDGILYALHLLAQPCNMPGAVLFPALDVRNCCPQRFDILLRGETLDAQLLQLIGQRVRELILFAAAGTDLVHLSLQNGNLKRCLPQLLLGLLLDGALFFQTPGCNGALLFQGGDVRRDGLPVRFGAVVLRFDPDAFLLRRRQFALRTG